MPVGSLEVDTLPKVLLRNYKRYGNNRIAMRKKKFGIWRSYTWKEYYEQVKSFSLGLISLGLQTGEKVAILGDNDPEWYWAELAAQAAGAVPTGIFSDSAASEVKYIVEHSESTFILARDQEQVDKVLSIKKELPRLQKIIYWDPNGLWGYDEPSLMSFADVVELGKKFDEAHPGLFEQNIDKTRGDAPSCLCYTSGTTGAPKGAILSHDSLIKNVRNWQLVDPGRDTFEYVSYMSPAWIAEQAFGITGSLLTTMKVNFLESAETVEENIREIAPHVLLYGSRLWESLASAIQTKITDAGHLKRFVYHLGVPVGHKIVAIRSQDKKPSLLWRILYNLSYLIVFRPLLDKHGLNRLRYCYTAGALLAPATFRLFRGIGLNLKQLFASTESAVTTIHRDENVRSETVGDIIPGIEVRIPKEGEILVRGEGVFPGYYKNPEETQKVLKGGWFHSGDGGYIDDTGQLFYWDRIAEMLELGDGSRFSPQYIEGSLRFSPYIKDVVVIGGKDKPFVTTLINIDFANVGQWAEAKRITYTTFTDLSQKPEVIMLIRKDIERLNRSLPEFARIKKYILLYKELDPDEAELTRTRKLKREIIDKRYQDMIIALYSDKAEVSAEAIVTYRDGRKGKVTTQVKVNSVEEGIL